MAQIGRPLKFTPQQIKDQVITFLEQCDNNVETRITPTGVQDVKQPKIPTLGMFQESIEMSRETWREYLQRPEFVDILKAIEHAVENRVESAMLNGHGSTAGAIFWLKARKGWQDKVILEQKLIGEGLIIEVIHTRKELDEPKTIEIEANEVEILKDEIEEFVGLKAKE